MTAYQLGYAMGLRTRIARVPVMPQADKARWRSGFRDAHQARRAAELNTARGFSFAGYSA